MKAENILLEDATEKNSSKTYKDFDDVLEEVGSVGKYQKIFLYGILFPLSVFESIFAINLWFLMDEPDHWCSVSKLSEADLNISLAAWKNLTIPRDENGRFSKCTMFSPNHSEIACTSGWEYDFTTANYKSILVDYNWVCDKSHYSTWVHTATNAGRAIGTLLLGSLADKIGRKPVFLITLMLFSIGRAVSLYCASSIEAFVALSLITGMSAPMFAISINTIAIELSGKEYRAWIYSFTWMTVVIGSALVPFIAFLSPNWLVLGWTTIGIGSLSYLFLFWIPESPRWLLSVGKTEEVVKILKQISSLNGTSAKFNDKELFKTLTEIEKAQKDASNDENKEKYKILGLFSKKQLSKNTLLIILTWVLNGLVFHMVNLNSLNLHGHRYLNFFLVILMEVPGGFFGGILSNKFGRRWMQVLFLNVCGIASLVAAYFSWIETHSADPSTFTTYSIVTAANVTKFVGTMSFLVIYLQALEIFPTPLRTTGSGVASTISSVTVIMVPLIVYQGKSSKITPWLISAILSFAGMISAAFIPETLNQKLPETIDEANNFGRDAKFWSFRLPKSDDVSKRTTLE